MAMQEYLASYAVKVDEDGARRLQSVLEQNRKTSSSLASSFDSARTALASLKKDLSSSVGLKDVFSSLTGSLSGLSGSLSSLTGGLNLSGSSAKTTVTVDADTEAADTALTSFKTKAEATNPRLSVNTSGITSAVSSAISTVKSMLSGLTVTIPVKTVTTVDTSSVSAQTSSSNSTTVRKYASGGRVSSPTLAMIAEEGSPEYVIPVNDEAQALPLLRSLMGELSASARAQLFLSSAGGPGGGVSKSVQAPVNISVTSSSAQAEAVGRSIYDTAQRSLLKTLQGVFN